MKILPLFSSIGISLRTSVAGSPKTNGNQTSDASNYDPRTYLYFEGYPYPEESPKDQILDTHSAPVPDLLSNELKIGNKTLEPRYDKSDRFQPPITRLRNVAAELGVPLHVALIDFGSPAVWLSRGGNGRAPDIEPGRDIRRNLFAQALHRFNRIGRGSESAFTLDLRDRGYTLRITWENVFDILWPSAQFLGEHLVVRNLGDSVVGNFVLRLGVWIFLAIESKPMVRSISLGTGTVRIPLHLSTRSRPKQSVSQRSAEAPPSNAQPAYSFYASRGPDSPTTP